MNEDREAFIQRMIEDRDLSRTMAAHMWDSRQPSLVECDACPTSGGCIEVCMKASAPASTEKTSDYSRVMMVGAFELGPRTLPMQVTDAGRNPLYEGLFEGETEDQRLARIVTAKDAEIARSKEAIGLWVDRASNWAKVNDELRTRLTEKDAAHAVTLEELHAMEVHVARAGREIEELRAQLAAQQEAVPVAWKVERFLCVGLDGREIYSSPRVTFDAPLSTDRNVVPLYAAPAAPQQGDDEPLRCDYCQCELTNPWHGSGIIEGKERRHIHACDACRGKLPGAVECESCRSGNGGYEALYRHACLEVRRLVNDLLAERNGVFPELVSHAFITSESGNDQYRVVMKFESLAQMQAAHNYLARLNADRSAQGGE